MLTPGEFREVQVPAFECRCARCDHTWVSVRLPDEPDVPPARCASCRSPYWKKPRGTGRQRGRPTLSSALVLAATAEGYVHARVAALIRDPKRGTWSCELDFGDVYTTMLPNPFERDRAQEIMQDPHRAFVVTDRAIAKHGLDAAARQAVAKALGLPRRV